MAEEINPFPYKGRSCHDILSCDHDRDRSIFLFPFAIPFQFSNPPFKNQKPPISPSSLSLYIFGVHHSTIFSCSLSHNLSLSLLLIRFHRSPSDIRSVSRSRERGKETQRQQGGVENEINKKRET